jgi:hypothetical protein
MTDKREPGNNRSRSCCGGNGDMKQPEFSPRYSTRVPCSYPCLMIKRGKSVHNCVCIGISATEITALEFEEQKSQKRTLRLTSFGGCYWLATLYWGHSAQPRLSVSHSFCWPELNQPCRERCGSVSIFTATR